ncbi:YeiH family protein [Demequina pelophila]|uniref:YeiH family protein n=1 Tax=Demequina pelophila TaxID=1638984 RepID=UPI0007864260|nr:putative sulfate exporter family transporter [Demequina pelophila]
MTTPTAAPEAADEPRLAPTEPQVAAQADRASSPGRAWREKAPGLALALVVAAVGMVTAHRLEAVSPLVLSLAIGAVVGSSLGFRSAPDGARGTAVRLLRPGTDVAAKTLLRVGVVLLGLQLSLPELLHLGWRGIVVVVTTFAVTFAATLALGRALRVSLPMRLLVATGFSICGASAISAMRGVVDLATDDADERDDALAASLALITLFGTLTIVLVPWAAPLLGLDANATGVWIGASAPEVGQSVAAGAAAGAAVLAVATVAKLARVVLLAPVIVVAGSVLGRGRGGAPTMDPAAPAAGRSTPLVPGFVLGFLAAVALRSTGWLPDGVIDALVLVGTVALVAAMFGIGLGIDVRLLARTGGSAAALGAASWLIATVVALAGVLLLM